MGVQRKVVVVVSSVWIGVLMSMLVMVYLWVFLGLIRVSQIEILYFTLLLMINLMYNWKLAIKIEEDLRELVSMKFLQGALRLEEIMSDLIELHL